MEMPEDERLTFLKEQNTTRYISSMVLQNESGSLICASTLFYPSSTYVFVSTGSSF